MGDLIAYVVIALAGLTLIDGGSFLGGSSGRGSRGRRSRRGRNFDDF